MFEPDVLLVVVYLALVLIGYVVTALKSFDWELRAVTDLSGLAPELD